ncbi:MAG: TonB-dependent receptor [Myxococcales bacterium]|nr:TonB-dependent receptor [Myxococcales bacterium]
MTRPSLFLLAWIVLALGPAKRAGAQTFNVTFLHTPTAKAAQGQDLIIKGNMIGADQISIAALAFRPTGTTEYEIRELRLVSGDLYEGVIPGKSVQPPGIEYFCYAVDFEGNRHVVFAAEAQPQVVSVVNPQTQPKPKPKPKPKPQPKPEPGGEGAVAGAVTIQLATRSAQSQEAAPAIVSVVERAEIEATGAQTVADLRDRLPGLHVVRSVSGTYRVAVRGVLSDAQVLVLLDGHRLNDLYDGSALLEFPAEAVERLELVRGPGSALYGTGAFMGVLNIVTREPVDPEGAAAYGLFNTARASAGGGFENEQFAVNAQAQFVFSQGQDRTVESDALSGIAGTIPKDAQGHAQDVSNTPGSVDDHRLQVHAQLRGIYKKLGGGELTWLSHYVFQTRGAYVGKYDTLDRGSDLQLHLVNTDLAYRFPIGQRVALENRFYFDTRLVDNAFQVIRAGENAYIAGEKHLEDGLRESTRYRTQTLGFESSGRFQLMANNLLIAGGQFEYLSLPDFTLVRDTGGITCSGAGQGSLVIGGFSLPCGTMTGKPEGQDRITFGFYAQDHWQDVAPGLDLLAGFRLDYSADFGVAVNPRVGVVYRPLPPLSFKALYAMAFRAPTFQELYDSTDFDPIRSFQGNQELGAVTIHTVEAGVEAHFESGPVEYRLRGNFFYNWIRNSIEPMDVAQLSPVYRNVEALDVFGTEVEGVARVGNRNRVYANSSWFRATATSAGQASSSYITDMPQMRFNAGFDLAVFEWLDLHVAVQYACERRNNTRQQMEVLRSFVIPAATTVNAGLSTQPILFNHLGFFAHAYNVFDADVRDAPPRPDRLSGLLPREPFSFLFGLRWHP